MQTTALRHPLIVETDRLEPLVRERSRREWGRAIEELTTDPDIRWALRERLHLVEHDTCSYSWYTAGKGQPDDKHQCQEGKGHTGLHLCACGAAERRWTPRKPAEPGAE